MAYQKILENVVVLGWGQRLIAGDALERPVSDTRLGPHPNDLITCLTTRADEIVGMITLHACTIHHICEMGSGQNTLTLIKNKALPTFNACMARVIFLRYAYPSGLVRIGNITDG